MQWNKHAFCGCFLRHSAHVKDNAVAALRVTCLKTVLVSLKRSTLNWGALGVNDLYVRHLTHWFTFCSYRSPAHTHTQHTRGMFSVHIMDASAVTSDRRWNPCNSPLTCLSPHHGSLFLLSSSCEFLMQENKRKKLGILCLQCCNKSASCSSCSSEFISELNKPLLLCSVRAKIHENITAGNFVADRAAWKLTFMTLCVCVCTECVRVSVFVHGVCTVCMMKEDEVYSLPLHQKHFISKSFPVYFWL